MSFNPRNVFLLGSFSFKNNGLKYQPSDFRSPLQNFVKISDSYYNIITIGGFLNMSIDIFFHQFPLFRYEEFTEWRKNKGEISTTAIIKNTLHYYVKIGRLLNIRRGIYAVIPPGESPNDFIVDPYLLAAKMTTDSVLGYHTALELYGVAYSMFNRFTFLTAQKSKLFEFQQQSFQPVSISKTLRDQAMIGIQKIDRQGVTLLVTTPARTFVDVIDRVNLSGGWEEIVRSISKMVVLDIDEVIRYCLLLNNKTLTAKVGFFLEQRQGAFSVSENKLKPLLTFLPEKPQYISDTQQGSCKLVKKWNLMIPSSVINQSWEEPTYEL